MFDRTRPFPLCVFMHGLHVPGVAFEPHIQASTGQMGAATTNTILALRPHDEVRVAASRPTLADPLLRGGSIAFFAVSSDHLDVPANGPPVRPMASRLNRLADRTAVLTC